MTIGIGNGNSKIKSSGQNFIHEYGNPECAKSTNFRNIF